MWNIPDSKNYVTYDIQAKVDLYGTDKTTNSAVLQTYPDTLIMSAYDMKQLSVLEQDNKILASPALIYTSDPYNGKFQFRVIAPDGQCIIGPTQECLVQDSTRDSRGGLESIEYHGQILRVKYTGPDNPLERSSITSVDPIVGDWTVSLETEEGLIPQAQAMKDLEVKIKHRFNPDTITVYSE